MSEMVQKYLSFILLTTLSFASFSQEREVQGDSKIKNVTVFLTGAQVERTAKVAIPSGNSVITFSGLTQHLDKNSIQVKANSSNITIASVSHKVDYLKDDKNMQHIQLLKDSLEDLQFKLSIRSSHETVYREEKNMLLANKSIRGEQNGVDVEDLMDMADFYRSRLQEIETKLLDIARSKTKLSNSIRRIDNELRRIQGNGGNYESSIIVKVSSQTKTTASFTLSYITPYAGWTPGYDIRSEGLDETINMTYKADVYQSTGYDWENVNLTLSTGNPSVNNTQPVFSPWYLAYYNEYKEKRDKGRSYGYKKSAAPVAAYGELEESANEAYGGDGGVDNDEVISYSIADFTTVSEGTVNTEFEISTPYTIKSNSEPEIVEIQRYDLPVSYKYFAMPKQDKDAFLMANISGWGEYSLLSGNANVYFEGTYVGESYLSTNTTDDTLAISMGRDKGIVITREKMKDYCKNTTFGGNKKSTRGYQISVRNTKKQAIDIEIVDQIPLSNTKDIEITVEENESGKYTETDGKLIWKLNVAPDSKQEVSFKFQVKYPKDKSISNL